MRGCSIVGCGLLVASVGCKAADDRSFADLQARGHVAMGVDQYTSSHVFESSPNGGRIALERDQEDPAGVTRIREHMRRIAEAFEGGDFRLPGAELRIVTEDSAAVDAIHAFLAFQRHDHRTGDSH